MQIYRKTKLPSTKEAGAAVAMLLAGHEAAYAQLTPEQATQLAQQYIFCRFDSVSIQGRQVTIRPYTYEAPFTFNRGMVAPSEVAELDTALTNPEVPNTLLVYFRHDTLSTAERDNFAARPNNRIINIPATVDTIDLMRAVYDSTRGWVRDGGCGLTSVGEPGYEQKSWGQVKKSYAIHPQPSRFIERWANTPHGRRRFR